MSCALSSSVIGGVSVSLRCNSVVLSQMPILVSSPGSFRGSGSIGIIVFCRFRELIFLFDEFLQEREKIEARRSRQTPSDIYRENE